MNDWKERIARLPATDRARLAERLGLTGGLGAAPGDPGDGVRVLVAFYTAAPGVELEFSALIEAAEARLPRAMVPRRFVRVPAFPRLPNGKIDRRQLAAFDAAARPSTPGPANPASLVPAEARTPMEQTLVAAWEAVLGRRGIGVDDDFFELGGDSIHAMQLLARLKESVPGLTLGLVFRRPTIRQLAAALVPAAPPSAGAPAIRVGLPVSSTEAPAPADVGGDQVDHRAAVVLPLGGGGAGPPFLFINGGRELMELARHLELGVEVFGLRVPYEAEILAARTPGRPDVLPTVEELAERYLALVRMRWPRGPYRLAGYCLGGWIATVVAERLRAAGEEVAPVVLVETWRADDSFHRRARRAHLYDGFRRLFTGAPAESLARARRWLTARRQLRRLEGKVRGETVAGGPEDDPQQVVIHLNGAVAYAAAQRFQPVPMTGQALVLRAADSLATMRRLSPGTCGESFWQALFPRGVRVVDLPGAHDGVLREPDCLDVARTIREGLAAPSVCG